MTATASLPRHYHLTTNETISSVPQLSLPPRKRRQSSDFPFSVNGNSIGSAGFSQTTENATNDGCGVLKALISNILTFAT